MIEIRAYSVVFWDFDGVIKESVAVKTDAYFQLFEPYGLAVANKVKAHHEANGGMSRFDKLPIYLQWAGSDSSQNAVDEYCEKFSRRVLQGVISSPWVAGVESFLQTNSYNQTFVLVSATPQSELEYILDNLGLANCFSEIFGAPTQKGDAIRDMLAVSGVEAHECLMIGDAQADLDAALANQVPFLLRKHASNTNVFASYMGDSVEDFDVC